MVLKLRFFIQASYVLVCVFSTSKYTSYNDMEKKNINYFTVGEARGELFT